MPIAIDAKPSKQRFDQHPRLARIARKKPVPVILGDDAEQVKLSYGLSEREYRDRLFRDFCDFCRKHNAWVISPSHEGSTLRAFPAVPNLRQAALAQTTQAPGTTSNGFLVGSLKTASAL
jgi:hypothetical protein